MTAYAAEQLRRAGLELDGSLCDSVPGASLADQHIRSALGHVADAAPASGSLDDPLRVKHAYAMALSFTLAAKDLLDLRQRTGLSDPEPYAAGLCLARDALRRALDELVRRVVGD